jgi:hypothetical protein
MCQGLRADARLEHHAHHIDSRWMVCSASVSSFVSQALTKSEPEQT